MVTSRSTRGGTLQYMAPEQLQGREADERTDVFAFGVVLYEMLTGRKAFDGTTDAALIGNILHSEPPSVSSLEPTTPPGLDRLVQLCLAKDPGARWQSFRDIRTRLAPVRDDVRPSVDEPVMQSSWRRDPSSN
jgi:eukaryotic-like serine/threonine-protein kinase